MDNGGADDDGGAVTDDDGTATAVDDGGSGSIRAGSDGEDEIGLSFTTRPCFERFDGLCGLSFFGITFLGFSIKAGFLLLVFSIGRSIKDEDFNSKLEKMSTFVLLDEEGSTLCRFFFINDFVPYVTVGFFTCIGISKALLISHILSSSLSSFSIGVSFGCFRFCGIVDSSTILSF